MKTVLSMIIILTALAVSIFGSQQLQNAGIDDVRATNIWMLCDAFAKVLFVISAMMHTYKVVFHLLTCVLIISLGNLIDEVMNWATLEGINDQWIGLFCLGYLVGIIAKSEK